MYRPFGHKRREALTENKRKRIVTVWANSGQRKAAKQMAINLVTVNARTRGKKAQAFTFQGVGKVTPRPVNGSDNTPIRTDGEPTVMVQDKDEKGNLRTRKSSETGNQEPVMVPADGQSFLMVDDINADGVITEMDEAVELISSLPADENDKRTPIQKAIDAIANYYNVIARDLASPVQEKPDVLGPVVLALRTAGILADDKAVASWRRKVTGGSDELGVTPQEFALKTKHYKAYIKAGGKPVELSA